MLQEASETLAALADAPPPSGLGELEAREFTAYSTWLKRSSEKLEARVKETKAARKLMESTKEMQEMNQSFNLQYLSLQQNMQAENRQFTMVSNLMKKNHAAAREAINNVR